MQLEVGKIVEGKVTGITKFGAFVELEPGTVGMVHISEVAPTYVNDISDHLTVGQQVTVKVLTVNEDGKISLSIKKAMKPSPQRDSSNREYRQNNQRRDHRDSGRNNNRNYNNGNSQKSNGYNSNPPSYAKPAQKVTSFEDMLSKFMQSSDEKISDIKKARETSRRSGQRRSSR